MGKLLIKTSNPIVFSGSTPIEETDWKEYIDSSGKVIGIYVDVDTKAAGFKSTPKYLASLGGVSWHWAYIGTTSIYSPTKTGFRVYLMNSPDTPLPTPAIAKEKKWHVNWLGVENFYNVGSTPIDNTDWKEYLDSSGKHIGIYVDVDTKAAGFKSTPKYLASLGGSSWHWAYIGATSIYSPTKTGFRVYLMNSPNAPLVTPAIAKEKKWHINWLGAEKTDNIGSTPVDKTDWKEYLNASGQVIGIYADVDTKSAGFLLTPKYFASLGGASWHWAQIGATSIYSPTKTGFRVYLKTLKGVQPSPAIAKEKKWHINWLGIEGQAPKVPSNLKIIKTTESSINLQWFDNSKNEDGFKIFRDEGSDSWNLISTINNVEGNGKMVSWIDLNLKSGHEYCYKIQSFNVYGASEFSNIVCGSTNDIAEKHPDIRALNIWMEHTDFPSPGEPFRIWFSFINVGNDKTGSFKIKMILNNNEKSTIITTPSYNPLEGDSAFWTFDKGLPEGNHYIYAYFDFENVVKEWNENDNFAYQGLWITPWLNINEVQKIETEDNNLPSLKGLENGLLSQIGKEFENDYKLLTQSE